MGTAVMDLRFAHEKRDFPELKVMYISVTVPHAEMRQTRMYFMKLGLYAFTKRAKPTGDVFIRYVGDSADEIQMEICFGVETFLPETKEIKMMTLPAMSEHFAVAYHKGPREELIDAYIEMGQWFAQQGLTRSGSPLIEYFVNDPRKTPKNELLTELYWPVLERPN